jgi:KaiC/GvpD/RAD55 family RecA-like ATPase
MADLIIGGINVTALLRQKYKKLGKGWLTLVEVPADKHMSVNSEAIKILVNELGYTCVYITLSKTAVELDKLFKTEGVDTNKLFFIDAISQMYGETGKESKRFNYTGGPLDVDSITVSLRELLTSIQAEKKCVFLDSVTTVLLYNSLPRTIRFSKFLTRTLKQVGVDGVMVSMAKGKVTKGLTFELQKLCDEFISITREGLNKSKNK